MPTPKKPKASIVTHCSACGKAPGLASVRVCHMCVRPKAKKPKAPSDSLRQLGEAALDFHRWTVGDKFNGDCAMLGATASARKMNALAVKVIAERAAIAAERKGRK